MSSYLNWSRENKHKIQVYLRDNAILPTKQTSGSIGFDLSPIRNYVIPPKSFTIMDTGVIVKPPKGYAVFVFPRSSLFLRKSLILTNSVGVIDPDYCGPDCTIKIMVYNLSDENVVVERGERVAQMVLLPIVENVEIEQVNEPFSDTSRGGLGSTGGYNS